MSFPAAQAAPSLLLIHLPVPPLAGSTPLRPDSPPSLPSQVPSNTRPHPVHLSKRPCPSSANCFVQVSSCPCTSGHFLGPANHVTLSNVTFSALFAGCTLKSWQALH